MTTLIFELECFLQFFKFIFIFKDFIEFVTILLLFHVLFFGHKAGGILVPPSGGKPTPSALEEVLTIGPSRKSIPFFFFFCNLTKNCLLLCSEIILLCTEVVAILLKTPLMKEISV